MRERRSNRISAVVEQPDHHCGDDLVYTFDLTSINFVKESDTNVELGPCFLPTLIRLAAPDLCAQSCVNT